MARSNGRRSDSGSSPNFRGDRHCSHYRAIHGGQGSVDGVTGKVALAVSRWSGLGIRFQFFDIIRHPLWITVISYRSVTGSPVAYAARPSQLLNNRSGQDSSGHHMDDRPGKKPLGLVSSRLGGYYPGAKELFRLSENVGIAIIGVVGALMILAVWQINLTPLLASAGLAGIIVGLAAKDTLGNFFGGISVFLDRPFKPGDYIVLRSGERGKVVDIGLRSYQNRDQRRRPHNHTKFCDS